MTHNHGDSYTVDVMREVADFDLSDAALHRSPIWAAPTACSRHTLPTREQQGVAMRWTYPGTPPVLEREDVA
jgi:hypothetical protein